MDIKLNILVVEDEFMTRHMLKYTLTELGHNVVGDTDNAEHAIQILEKEHVDLAILDINLGEHSEDGIYLGEYIRIHHRLPFVYLTAYGTTEFVDRAISTQPHAYLTKPFNEVMLRTTLAIAAQQYQLTKNQPIGHLTVKNGLFMKQLDYQEILFLESDSNYLLVHTELEQYRYRSTIEKMETLLPTELFLRTHRAFIVNRMRVTHVSDATILMGQKQIPIARGRRTEVWDALGGSADVGS